MQGITLAEFLWNKMIRIDCGLCKKDTLGTHLDFKLNKTLGVLEYTCSQDHTSVISFSQVQEFLASKGYAVESVEAYDAACKEAEVMAKDFNQSVAARTKELVAEGR